jgi:hypothetical protein
MDHISNPFVPGKVKIFVNACAAMLRGRRYPQNAEKPTFDRVDTLGIQEVAQLFRDYTAR